MFTHLVYVLDCVSENWKPVFGFPVHSWRDPCSAQSWGGAGENPQKK